MAMIKTGNANSSQGSSPGESNVYTRAAQRDMFGNVIQPSATYSLQGTQSNDPYRYGLNTNYTGIFEPGKGTISYYGNDTDADVREAQHLADNLSEARYANTASGRSTDQTGTQAKLDALLAKIGQRNTLGKAIHDNADLEANAENDLRYKANDALSSGVKNTRENYNSRGLLYSGLRQGGESSVRSGVAGNLAQNMAQTKADYANLKDQQKLAYAAVGKQQEAQRVAAANEAFDNVTKNNVARAQAQQQLGEGFGRLAGMAYSAYGGGGGGSGASSSAPRANSAGSSYNDYGSYA